MIIFHDLLISVLNGWSVGRNTEKQQAPRHFKQVEDQKETFPEQTEVKTEVNLTVPFSLFFQRLSQFQVREYPRQIFCQITFSSSDPWGVKIIVRWISKQR